MAMWSRSGCALKLNSGNHERRAQRLRPTTARPVMQQDGVFRSLKAETKIDRATAFRGLSLLVCEARNYLCKKGFDEAQVLRYAGDPSPFAMRGFSNSAVRPVRTSLNLIDI